MSRVSPHHRQARRLMNLVVLAALPLCACDATLPKRLDPRPESSTTSTSPTTERGNPGGNRTTDRNQPPQRQPNQRPLPVQGFNANPTNARPAASLQTLFARGTVSGRDLIFELRAIQAMNRAQRTQRSFATLMGAVDRSVASRSTQAFNWNQLVKGVTDAMVAEIRTSVSNAALDQFLTTVVGDEQALARETITLPSARGLNRFQQQRIANMAAMVIGARIAERVLTDADKTFTNMEGEYQDLMTRRQQIAGVLADVVDKRRKALAAKDEMAARQMTGELSRYLGPEDIQFIDTFAKDMSLKEFSNDFAMQNIALQYLRKSEPKAYQDYRAKADGLVGHARAYVKTIGGVAAYGGLLVGFFKEANDMAQTQNGQEIISALPLGSEFISSMVPLVPTVAKTTFSGVVIEPTEDVTGWLFGTKRFRVTTAQGDADARSATDVYKAIQQAGEEARFQEALFRGNSSGFLYKLYTCDGAEVGRMIDNTVQAETLERFQREFVRNTAVDFSFVNALSDPRSPRHSQIVSQFLDSDQRQRSNQPIVGETQRQVASGYGKWTESQLTRLILANHTGSPSHAQMQVGGVQVRLIPSMTAVVEYEGLQDSCRRTASRS